MPILSTRQIRSIRRATLACAALCACHILSSTSASAQSFGSWNPIYQGIDYTTGFASGSSDSLYAMRIDLTAPGIGFETTPSNPTAVNQGFETYSQTTGAFLTSVNAQVAINGNFFSNVQTTSVPENLSGLAVSNGSVVAAADPNFQSLFLSATNAASIGSSASFSIFNAVSGVQVLQNGVAMTPNSTSGDPTGLDPRTDVGVSQDGRYLYLLVADGRSTQSPGITDLQAGQLLQQLGAYNGLNLDGGGSSAMVKSDNAGGAVVLNVPSGGTQRLDGNNLAIFGKQLVSTPNPTNGIYSQAVLNYHPALYYQLTEASSTTAFDSSGNGFNGSYPASGMALGKASTPITSQPNTSVLANGTAGSHVSVPYNSSMSAGSFTIMAWANPTSSSGITFGAVVSERNDKGGGAAGNAGFILYDGPASSATGTRWQFWLGGNTSQTYNYEGRNQSGDGLGPVATANQWAFVVGTFTATSGPDSNGRYTGTQDLYVNGVLQLSLANVSYLPDTSTPLYIGAGANETSPSDQFDFNGSISQVALYDTALTSDQIMGIYNSASVPEPSALGLTAIGALAFAGRRRRATR